MKNLKQCYNQILARGSFDINAGVDLNEKMDLPCPEFAEYAKNNVESGAKSCCLHFATYFSKLLNDNGIYSELIITREKAFNPDGTPVIKPDGSQRIDYRASVMYMDENGKICVANPVEDVEMFDKLATPHEKRTDAQTQKQVYDKKATLVEEMRTKKSFVPLSENGLKIPLEEFIENYAKLSENGQTFIATLGNLFDVENKNKTFRQVLQSCKRFSAADIPSIAARFEQKQNNKKND